MLSFHLCVSFVSVIAYGRSGKKTWVAFFHSSARQSALSAGRPHMHGNQWCMRMMYARTNWKI